MLHRVCVRLLSTKTHKHNSCYYQSKSRTSKLTSPCNGQRHDNNEKSKSSRDIRYMLLGSASVAGASTIGADKEGVDQEPEDHEYEIEQVEETKFRKTRMFRHFCSFASLKFKTEMYMTANDFFRAILSKKSETDRSSNIKELKEEEYQEILDSTPIHCRAEQGLLMSLGDKALISYPEYLFLLSLISTPKDNFLRAFQIIDIDGNWILEKEEFETVQTIFLKGVAEQNTDNTTIKVHFFKMDGKGIITFEDFVNFLDGLQEECLQVEFNMYSNGSDQLSDRGFTELLLSRTTLGEGRRAEYLRRVGDRQKDPVSNSVTTTTQSNTITFKQFSQFMHLLNDIHDLDVALRMFQIAKKPITPEEFKRAVRVCTGTPLDDTMVTLTFKIFDDDGDGHLSHEEFMKVMKERKRTQGTVDTKLPANSWKAFMRCVNKQELARQ